MQNSRLTRQKCERKRFRFAEASFTNMTYGIPKQSTAGKGELPFLLHVRHPCLALPKRYRWPKAFLMKAKNLALVVPFLILMGCERKASSPVGAAEPYVYDKAKY